MQAGAGLGLERLLRRAGELAAAATASAVALDALEAIALPPPGGAADQAQLRALATLYLAAELEGAGAVPAAEALVRLARSGGIARDFGAATPLMQSLWQTRNERIGSGERMAVFSRLFGTPGATDDAQGPRNAAFEERLIDLCESLMRLEEGGGGIAATARVRATARRLLDALVRAGSGFTALVAQEMLDTLKLALAILGHADVKAAFGARSVWDVVAAIDRLQRQPPRPHELHLRRGQAGMTLLAWLAEASPRLDGGALPGLDAALVEAAIDWLEASLALGEAGGPSASPAAPASDWARLAA